MGEKKNMYAKLESLASKFYESEQEVLADQERIINEIFDKDPAFAYLKEDSTLSNQVRNGSMQGLREGIAAFMSESNVTDLCAVFDNNQHFSDFYYSKNTYDAIASKLKKDGLLIKKLCKTEALSVYECEHIAEVISSTYKDEMLTKLLILGGVISPIGKSDIDMPEEPNKFDE